jgi:hypothetical protein
LNQNSLARLLSRTGFLLLVLFALLVGFDVFPPQLLKPDWITNFAFALSNYIMFPIVGIVLIHLAAYLSPVATARSQLSMARLAALLALLYLLLQPMLVFAVWRNSVDLAANNKQQLEFIQNKSAQLRRAIQTSASFEELQSGMLRLQGPQVPDQARAIALPELKTQVLEAVKAAEAAFPARLNTTSSPAYREVYKRIVRTAAIAVLGTFAFVILAWNPANDSNIILTYLKTIGLFGITTGDLQQKISFYLRDAKIKREREAGLKASRAASSKQDRQMRQEMEKRMREEKRRQAADRKRAQALQRQRDRNR